ELASTNSLLPPTTIQTTLTTFNLFFKLPKWYSKDQTKRKQMLQLFFTVAFSAVPLTLYVPPIRSLSLFVETIEDMLRQTTLYTLRVYPRIRLGFSRIFHSIFRLS
ncbi:hypothetical protein Gorai_023496, partial [Gossypium raimondii]|nr:hypothetical protein [Gossypium raimondii]